MTYCLQNNSVPDPENVLVLHIVHHLEFLSCRYFREKLLPLPEKGERHHRYRSVSVAELYWTKTKEILSRILLWKWYGKSRSTILGIWIKIILKYVKYFRGGDQIFETGFTMGICEIILVTRTKLPYWLKYGVSAKIFPMWIKYNYFHKIRLHKAKVNPGKVKLKGKHHKTLKNAKI